MRRFVVAPGGQLVGERRVPGDKSISHRSIILSAISEGASRITGFLESQDCLATMSAFKAMGVRIKRLENALSVDGVGLHGLQAPQGALDLGNSGTSMRLLSGLLAGQRFGSRLIGDASLSKRPMARVIEPLTRMGAAIAGDSQGRAPLSITGGRALRAIDYASPVASAQIKSCILLAGLYADDVTSVTEPGVSRDHSERMLAVFGASVEVDGRRVSVSGQPKLRAREVAVPADLSSAAFFMVGAAIAAGSALRMTGVGINPTRRGVIDILKAMGADIALADEREVSGEPVADLTVSASELHGVDIDGDQVALAIDEFPAIFIAAACARGVTTLRGADELRVKESDRIAVMAEGLAALGVEVDVFEDGLAITGKPEPGSFTGGETDSFGVPRTPMAFAMAGLRAAAPITINDCDNVDTSFPGFVELARGMGLDISTQEIPVL